jgi:hypothetical protein
MKIIFANIRGLDSQHKRFTLSRLLEVEKPRHIAITGDYGYRVFSHVERLKKIFNGWDFSYTDSFGLSGVY